MIEVQVKKGGFLGVLQAYGQEELTRRQTLAKLKKRESASRQLELKHNSFFTNHKITFETANISLSRYDLLKGLKFPQEMTFLLAEELGAHVGDGCMSKNKNYFSVKCTKKERAYITHLCTLYKQLYNLELKIVEKPSVCGVELCSKGLCEFKNRVIGLPFGEKVGKVQVPASVLESRNKEVYRAFIRGMFDTDGCIYLAKNKQYPVISITTKSEILIGQLGDMFLKLGFFPVTNKSVVNLNGQVMLKKWLNEIGSSNPTKLEQLQNALVV